MLVACWCLDDDDRRTALLDRRRALDAALYTNWAFAASKELDRARQELEAELDEDPNTAHDAASVVDAALAHIADIHAAQHGAAS